MTTQVGREGTLVWCDSPSVTQPFSREDFEGIVKRQAPIRHDGAIQVRVFQVRVVFLPWPKPLYWLTQRLTDEQMAKMYDTPLFRGVCISEGESEQTIRSEFFTDVSQLLAKFVSDSIEQEFGVDYLAPLPAIVYLAQPRERGTYQAFRGANGVPQDYIAEVLWPSIVEAENAFILQLIGDEHEDLQAVFYDE